MLQLTLCGALCDTFTFPKFKTKSVPKSTPRVDSFVQSISTIVAMQEEKFKIYDHILYKLIQSVGGELGCIVRPLVSSDKIVLSRYAASPTISSDFINYCSSTKQIVDDVFRHHKVYIQNKCNILHLPYVKRLMIVPIVIQDYMFCVIVANKLQPFVKADATLITTLLKVVLYIFTSDCLLYDTDHDIDG